jgi:phycobilisome rod-core linker protein
MSIPLLEYAPISRNHRVVGFEVPGEEYPRLFDAEAILSVSEVDELIQAAYRQVFNEQQMLASHRQRSLESRLKSGSITVREFIQGLATSDSFRRLNYEANSNYRFAEMCVQRILGREVYGDRESMSWSIVLATQGLNGFIDVLVHSQEYSEAFGDSVVPYQRRRILPQHAQGDLPFARMARYGDAHLDELKSLGNDFTATGKGWPARYVGLPPQTLRSIGAGVTYGLGGFLLLLLVGVVLSWFGWLSM